MEDRPLAAGPPRLRAEDRLRQDAGVERLPHPGADGLAQPLEIAAAPRIGGEVVQFVRVGDHVVEFVGRAGRAREPAGSGRQRARLSRRAEFAGDRHAGGVVGQIVAVEPGEEVADVAGAGVAGRAAEAGRRVHPVAGRDHDLTARGISAEEGPALEPRRPRHAGEVEHCGAEINEAHERRGRAGRFAAVRQPRRPPQPCGHVHEERHAEAVLRERPLAVRDALAVVAPEEHDRVVGEAVGLEFGEDLPGRNVEGRGEFEPLGKGAADRRRVGIVRRHGHVGGLAAGLRRKVAPHPLRLVAEQAALVGHVEVEDREERLVGLQPVAPVGLAVRLVPARVERGGEVVVGLRVVRAVVARRAERARESRHLRRRRGPAAHRQAAERGRHQAGDDGAARRRADGRRREGRVEPQAVGSEPVESGGVGRAAVAAEGAGGEILGGDPEDVGAGSGCRGGERDEGDEAGGERAEGHADHR